MSKKDYSVTAGIMELPDGHCFEVGSSEWWNWVTSSQAESFRFECDYGVKGYRARKEGIRSRSGSFWYAYKRVDGKLRKRYLGKSEELSLERLESIAYDLAKTTEPRTRLELPNQRVGNYLAEADEQLLAGGNVSQGIKDLVATAKAEKLKPVDAEISPCPPLEVQHSALATGVDPDSLNRAIAQALAEIEELRTKRRQDLNFSHVRAVGLSAEIEKLESKLQLSALEKIRDRLLLTQTPPNRKKLKKILDQFVSELASGET